MAVEDVIHVLNVVEFRFNVQGLDRACREERWRAHISGDSLVPLVGEFLGFSDVTKILVHGSWDGRGLEIVEVVE